MAWFKLKSVELTEPAGVVAEALEEQARFESTHPVPFTVDQRIEAVLGRLELKKAGLRSKYKAEIKKRLGG